MRHALIADIHGNCVALEAVLRDCETQRVDEVLCLGDMIGFLSQPVACVDQVRKSCKWSLAGDHELSLSALENFDGSQVINKGAHNSLIRQKRALKPRWYSFSERRARWAWLMQLEPRRTYAGAMFVHASPRDPVFEYVLPNDFESPPSQKILDVFASFEGLCFAAHSHTPGVASGAEKWLRPADFNMTFQLGRDAKAFVNVGSVGQPRDGDPRSCYAIWDDALATVEFRRVEYDLEVLRVRYAKVMDENSFYFERLKKGQ